MKVMFTMLFATISALLSTIFQVAKGGESYAKQLRTSAAIDLKKSIDDSGVSKQEIEDIEKFLS